MNENPSLLILLQRIVTISLKTLGLNLEFNAFFPRAVPLVRISYLQLLRDDRLCDGCILITFFSNLLSRYLLRIVCGEGEVPWRGPPERSVVTPC